MLLIILHTARHAELSWRSIDDIARKPVQLECLHTLSLMLPGSRGSTLLTKVLQMLDTPNLVRFGLIVGGPGDPVSSGAYHSRLFPYIAKHHKLTCLLVSTEARSDTSNSPQDKLLGLNRERIVTSSENVQLLELTLTETQVPFENWILFLKGQKGLRVYQVLHLIPLPVHRATIRRCAESLRKIALHVQPTAQSPFDLSILRKCPLLEEVYICYEKKSREYLLCTLLSYLHS
jgi:hypothetical protein